jgi:hypothetical protein
MENIFTEFTMSRFSFLRLVLFIAGIAFPLGNLFSQTKPDLWGFDRGVLDYYFDRADREISPGRWMEEAGRSRDLALRLWEELVPDIIADPSQADRAKKELAEWSETELENRFTRWLLERFFGRAVETAAASVSSEIRETGKILIYKIGEDGNILYDENSGDPLVIRPWTEGYNFETDLALWRENTARAAETEITGYEARLAALYPEILSCIAPENREAFEKKMAAASGTAVLSLRKEFDSLLSREERYFTARRLGDVWSLRKKSEDESAGAIGSRIIEETSSVVAESLEKLEQHIEAARAGTGDLVLAGAEWLEQYQEQFERGLKAWADAEERFFTRRIEWELDAERYYAEGEKAWNDAYAMLETERKNWEAKTKTLFESGENLFIRASENLEQAIALAKIEFEKESGLRVESAVKRAGAWVDMYITCGSIAAEARTNIDFWQERYRKEPKASNSSGEITAMILAEIKNWTDIYQSYSGKAAEARETLINEFDFVMGSGTLAGILAEGRSSDDFNLDEYQIELIRARASSAYWAKRTAIAEAVSEYAEDLTAGRITEGEGFAAWEKAGQYYDESVRLYKELEEELGAAGAAVAGLQKTLSEAAVRLKEADAVLRELKQAYTSLAAIYELQENASILEELNSRYLELLEEEKILDPASNDSIWTQFINTSMDLIFLENNEAAWEILEQLVEGTYEEKPLADLYRAALEIKTISEAGDIPGRIEELGISKENPRFFLVQGFWDEMNSKLAAAENEDDKEAIRSNYCNIITALAADIKNEADIELEIRLAAMNLLLNNNKSNILINEDIEAAIKSARLNLLNERIELELEALNSYIYGTPAGESAETLAFFCTISPDEARGFVEVLEELLVLFTGEENRSIFELEELLNLAAEESSEKNFFLNGGSFIDPFIGAEITGAFLGDFVAACRRIEGMLSAYINAGFLLTNEKGFTASEEELFSSLEETFEFASSWSEGEFDFLKNMLVDIAVKRKKDSAYQNLYDELQAQIHNYIEDPLLAWQGKNTSQDFSLLYDTYEILSLELENYLQYKAGLKQEIESLEKNVELFNKGLPGIKEELENKSAELRNKEKEYAEITLQYETACENFRLAGESYDLLYKNVKNRYEAMEEARFNYEIQDAIRRWAGTAYLDAGQQNSELLYSREKLELSQAALDMLIGLYNNDETRRYYENAEYDSLLDTYEENLSQMILLQKAKNSIDSAVSKETDTNRNTYNAYKNAFDLMGIVINADSSYVSPEDKSLWGIIDLICLKDGMLQFSYNENYKFSENNNMASLAEYFSANIINGSETKPVSSFELALRELTERLESYNFSRGKYEQWGLARDYLINNLIRNNSGLGFLKQWYHNAQSINQYGNLGKLEVIILGDPSYRTSLSALAKDSSVNGKQYTAWNSLSESEKRDLEFYTVLTLFNGGGSGSEYFSRVSEYLEYCKIWDPVYSRYKRQKRNANKFLVGFLYKNAYDEAKYTKNALEPVYRQMSSYVGAGYSGMKSGVDSMNQNLAMYLESSERLNILNGGQENSMSWEAMEKAVSLIGGFSDQDIAGLKDYWNNMAGRTNISGLSLSGTLELFIKSCGIDGEKAKQDLENFWNSNKGEFIKTEESYLAVYDAYLNGNASLEDLAAAADRTYKKEFVSRKTYTEDLGESVMKNLFSISGNEGDYNEEYNLLANEYVSLITSAYSDRYKAELDSRETEWQEQRRDINEKYKKWLNEAASMIEKGRYDWKETTEKFNDAYMRWADTYTREYQQTDEAWTAAYLEGLKDKEAWAAQATRAAAEAASGAILALVGSDAESMARAMDTRDPAGFAGTSGLEEAEKTLRKLLETADVNRVHAALGAVNNSAGTLMTEVRHGAGGLNLWNYGTFLTEASRLAKTAEEELAARESKKIALYVKDATAEAVKALSENLRKANGDFRKQMDETFIIGGQWKKSGSAYIKDVLVHSTLFDSVITDRALVEGYSDFIMPALELSTGMSEDRIRSLNPQAIEVLIRRMYSEVAEYSKIIFGSGSESDIGEFYRYLGSQPKIKSKPNITKGKSGVFDSYGSGELGRLMTGYYYWMFKENMGMQLMSAPFWNKPLWDSRDGLIQAPSIRTIVDMGIQVGTMIAGTVSAPFSGGTGLVGAIAFNAALNTSDDLVFNLLDVGAGVKSWGEAGFDFGKNLLLNTGSSAAGSLFQGIKGRSIMTDAVTGGLETFAAGTVNSLLGGISYDDKNGWGYSGSYFADGFADSWRSALSSFVGEFTTGSLNRPIGGFTGNLYSNGAKLNNLTGGLATQGINYATGGDFVLNVLNTGILPGVNSAGLFEIHFGRDGIAMKLGTGGVDTSIGALISATKGLEAWRVNSELLFSKEGAAKKYSSQLRTLYSMGGLYRGEYENYMAGKTKIAESGEQATQSVYDPVTGVKTVRLGSGALNDQSRFGLNVVLSHEANRDGITGDETEQKAETRRAVLGHMATALELLKTYNGGLGMNMTIEALLFSEAQRTGDFSVASAIAGSYDSSADYWKLISKADGTHGIVWDGKKYLTVEYQNEKGEVISRVIPAGQEYTSKMGLAESLANAIGFSRAEEILGSSLTNAKLYTFGTLKDVLQLSDVEIERIQQSGVLPPDLTDKQRRALAGEALLYTSGASWNGSAWINTKGINLRLTGNVVNGFVLAESIAEGGFGYSTVVAYIARNTDSYLGWSYHEKEKFNISKQGLDSIFILKSSLDGRPLRDISLDGFHTVDNMTTNSEGKNLNQPYKSRLHGNVQGNTIAPGVFNMTYYDTSDYYGEVNGINNAVMVINNASTIGGAKINNAGNGGNDKLRWLVHSNRELGKDRDYNSYYSDGCFVAPSATLNRMYSYLSSIGLQRGYQIKTYLWEF